jgi:hypothetical protein
MQSCTSRYWGIRLLVSQHIGYWSCLCLYTNTYYDMLFLSLFRDCVTKSCPIRSVDEDGTVTLTRGSSLTKAWKTSWSRYRHNMMKYSAIFDHSRVGVKKYSKSEYILYMHIICTCVFIYIYNIII